MRTLTQYHNKHVLISGQGPTEEIGRMYVIDVFRKKHLIDIIVCLDLVLKVSQQLKKSVKHFPN